MEKMENRLARLCGFFIKSLLQPLILQGIDFHAALRCLFFYFIQQFELDGNGAQQFELGLRRVGIKPR